MISIEDFLANAPEVQTLELAFARIEALEILIEDLMAWRMNLKESPKPLAMPRKSSPKQRPK